MADAITLQARLEKLRSLRADGVRTARFGEDEVTFRSDAELAVAIADLEGQIAAGAGRTLPRFINIRTKNGWL